MISWTYIVSATAISNIYSKVLWKWPQIIINRDIRNVYKCTKTIGVLPYCVYSQVFWPLDQWLPLSVLVHSTCITECCIKAETVVVNGSSVLFILSIWLVVLAMQVTDPWCIFNTLHVMTCTIGVSFIWCYVVKYWWVFFLIYILPVYIWKWDLSVILGILNQIIR